MNDEHKIEEHLEIDNEQSNEEQNNQEPKRKRPVFPTIISKEDARKVFFGNNAEYYMNFYKKYNETGKKISWNWCSCLLSPMWFFARKMYLFGALFTFISTLFSLGASMIFEHGANQKIMSLMLPWSIAFLLFSVCLGLFGNYLYITHMENKIKYPGESGLNNQQVAQFNLIRGGISVNGILTGYVIVIVVSSIVNMLIV